MELKRFFWFSNFTGSYRGLNFWENRVNSVAFIHIFRNFRQFSTKILPILIKIVNSFKNVFLILFLNIKIFSATFIYNFCQKICLNILKFNKNSTKKSFFSPLWLSL